MIYAYANCTSRATHDEIATVAKIACIELSRARFFAAALMGQRLVWHMHAEDRQHAYVTLPDGTPIAEEETDAPEWPYRPIMSI